MTPLMIDRANLPRTTLDGHVAVVTGAGRGIGRETARTLARLGAAVVIAEISESGRDTEQVIRAEGGRALFVQTDVADPTGIERLRDVTSESFGDADIVVNNAVAFNARPLLDLTLEEWERTFAVNLRGAFLTLKAFVPAMLQRRSGVFITMESAEGMPYLAPYLATKVGLRSLAQSLALEVGDDSGVSVYCFGPGLVKTPALLGAIETLGPLYGMSKEEFLGATGMEMVDAELCAVGLVGTILHAREYHGQETGYGDGLVHLGLDSRGERAVSGSGEIAVAGSSEPTAAAGASGVTSAAPSPAAALGGDLHRVIELNRRVEAMLRDNIREYEELTMFQRPIMRRMFQTGTGRRVEDWLAHAAGTRTLVTEAAEKGMAPDGAKLSAYVADLNRLGAFVTKQESDARGFIRDPEKLTIALAALRARRAVVDELAEAVKKLIS